MSYIQKMLWSLEMRPFGEKSPIICVLHAAADPSKWQCSALGLGPSSAHKGAWPPQTLFICAFRSLRGGHGPRLVFPLKRNCGKSQGAQVPEHIKFSKQVLPVLLRIQSFVTD